MILLRTVILTIENYKSLNNDCIMMLITATTVDVKAGA